MNFTCANLSGALVVASAIQPRQLRESCDDANTKIVSTGVNLVFHPDGRLLSDSVSDKPTELVLDNCEPNGLAAGCSDSGQHWTDFDPTQWDSGWDVPDVPVFPPRICHLAPSSRLEYPCDAWKKSRALAELRTHSDTPAPAFVTEAMQGSCEIIPPLEPGRRQLPVVYRGDPKTEFIQFFEFGFEGRVHRPCQHRHRGAPEIPRADETAAVIRPNNLFADAKHR